MSGSRPDGRAGGFTLLEVLVALAIAGLALVTLFRAGGEGVVAVDTATRVEEAVQRAQSHLAAVGRDVALLQSEAEGDDGGGYHWRLRIAPVATLSGQGPAGGSAPSSAGTTLFDVEVAIFLPGRGQPRSVVLRTQRLAAASFSE
jgi:general secretion pathway protein I